MGAAKNTILAGFFVFSLSSFGAVRGMSFENSFNDIKDVKQWSEKEFFGGYESHEFNQDGKALLVIIGMPTSGFATSQILVYQRVEKGYRFVLFRNTVSGIVTIKNNDTGIQFRVDNETILSLPWKGVE